MLFRSQSPDWPALWWNLMTWRSSEMPGPARTLLHVGEMASVLSTATSTSPMQVIDPQGTRRDVPQADHRAQWLLDTPGVYRVNSLQQSPASTPQFICANLGDAAKSDLTQKTTGNWGQWTNDASGVSAYRSAAWLLMLLAIGGIVVHAAAVARSVSGGVRT